jgi:hypothetical protein
MDDEGDDGTVVPFKIPEKVNPWMDNEIVLPRHESIQINVDAGKMEIWLGEQCAYDGVPFSRIVFMEKK